MHIGKKGTFKDLIATISTAVKNHRVDQITDDVYIKDSFLLVLQTLQKQLVKYGYTITCMDPYTKSSRYG